MPITGTVPAQKPSFLSSAAVNRNNYLCRCCCIKSVNVSIHIEHRKESLGFEFSVRQGSRPLIEGRGELGNATIVMGRYWKSTFLSYLFALLSMDYELAICTSERVLSPGGFVRLRVSDAVLECGMAEEDGGVGCSITYRLKEEAYLLYEGFLLTLRYGFVPSASARVAEPASLTPRRGCCILSGARGRAAPRPTSSPRCLKRPCSGKRGCWWTASWTPCTQMLSLSLWAQHRRPGRASSWRPTLRGSAEPSGATAAWPRRWGCPKRPRR